MAFVARLRPVLVARLPATRLFHARRAPRSVLNPSAQKSALDHGEVEWDYLYKTAHALPQRVFDAAVDDGRIDVSPSVAVSVAISLIYYLHRSANLIPARALDAICRDNDLTGPTTIARVAIVMANSPTHRVFAVRSLRSLAVEIGEPVATMAMAFTYLRGQATTSQAERERFTKSLLNVASDGIHPHALVLHSYFCPRSSAMSWLERAHALARPVRRGRPTPLAALLPPEVPPPWCAYADALVARGDPEAAMAAVEVGMNTFDSPLAYQRMAQLLATQMRKNEPVDLGRYEDTLLKSAMAHNPHSCYLLGNLYLTIHLEVRGDPSAAYGPFAEPFTRRHHDDYYRMFAVEWYELAIQAGILRPALILAALCRREGKPRPPADYYLDLAEQDKGCATMVRALRDRWDDDTLTVDIPGLMTV